MTIYYAVMFFILGTIFGSFYHVVGSRMPKGESIVTPRSHCDNCKHVLTPFELIPVFSYFLQKGKCRGCGEKISIIHPLFELFVGLLFSISYLTYGLSLELLLILTIISILVIVIDSDFQYMIICDEVLITGTIFVLLELYFLKGFSSVITSCINGLLAFAVMFGIKKLGNYLFKKESMGDGDIKLLGFLGLAIGFGEALSAIFIGSVLGLIYTFIRKGKIKILPFGPFLSLGAIILIFLHFNFNEFILFLSSLYETL